VEKPVGREVLSLFLAAAVGGVISFGFQTIAATSARAAARREARRVSATQLFKDVGGLMDARYYFLANRPPDAPTEAREWKARTDSLNDIWHERAPTNVALMCDYFGEPFARSLLSVADALNILEIGGPKANAEASKNARHAIFLLELRLADELRRGDILDQDQPLGDCEKLG
jgi:hypothetical protein